MRIQSCSLGLLATASLALASACKPRPSSGASSVISSSSSIQPSAAASAPSSAISSSVLASSSSSSAPSSSSSSSAAPIPVATFYIAAGNTGQAAVDGLQLETDGVEMIAEFGGQAGWSVNTFHLEAGTNYLTSADGLYVCYDPSNTALYLMTPGVLYDMIPLVCGPTFEGVPMSCAPDGVPTATVLAYSAGLTTIRPVLRDPSAIPSGYLTMDFIPQPVEAAD